MSSSFVKSLLSSGAILPIAFGAVVVTTAALVMGTSARAESPDAPDTFIRGGHIYNVKENTFTHHDRTDAAPQNFTQDLPKDYYRFYPDTIDLPGTFYAPGAGKTWPMKNGKVVKELRVEGDKDLEAGFAERYILGEDHAKRTRPGEPFDYDQFVLAVTSLFATGMFWEIIVHTEGDTLVVNAIESPVVRGEVIGREDLRSAEEQAELVARNKLTKREAQALYMAVGWKMVEEWEKSQNEIVSEYTEWKRYNFVPFQIGKYTGGHYVNLYANDKVDKWGNFNRMPTDTILVLESFHGDGNRTGFTARWKAGELVILEKMEKGFSAATGDWKITRIDDKGNAADITKERGAKSNYLFAIPDEYKKTIYFETDAS